MKPLPALHCPDCGTPMEFVRPNGSAEIPPNLLRVCLACGTLACTFDDGTVGAMRPTKVEVVERAG